ncbi:patatin-like phospholipase domain-containing protein 2 [Galendromus occidentalis]|uniref:triacylglycerol lipase n=1 Tax=Galendromus occidentalis TaxID=34638 RepID=A0AAJ6QQF9_9ACAR|nr:patatin-like phospholipase domain-containing protein 2 [Galendromus occidentalis]
MATMKQVPMKGRDFHLSLSGCGFLGLYHVGVISAFHEYARHLCVNRIAGASAGSLAAACLICDVAFGEATTSILRLAVQARRRALGPFHPGFDINALLYDIFIKILPDNAHELCSGRLYISLTRVSDGANVLISNFSTKEDLVKCLMCSCFIPVYSGLVPPRINGVAYIDGGFSDNLPLLDENTITVSPFSGENDICPEDESFNMMLINLSNTSIAVSPANIYRFVRILFPPHPEILARMTQQGFDDAVKYLQRHNLISCTRCLAVKSSFDITMSDDEDSDIPKHEYDGCDDCKTQKQIADNASLPEPIREPMMMAAENENRGLVNWLFKHRPIKILSYMTLPYVLPFDITMAVAKKVIPTVRKELTTSFFNVIDKLKEVAVPSSEEKWQKAPKSPPVSQSVSDSRSSISNFSCKLAITEFNYNLESKTRRSTKVRSRSLENLRIAAPGVTDTQKRREQRKSYAGLPYEKRVIQQLELDSKLALSHTFSRKRKTSMINALRSLDQGEPSVTSAIDITNDALDYEKCTLKRAQAHSLEQILNVTQRREAAMAFYYTDENNCINVTEIFDYSEKTDTPQTSPERAPQEGRRRKKPVF